MILLVVFFLYFILILLIVSLCQNEDNEDKFFSVIFYKNCFINDFYLDLDVCFKYC